MALDRKLSLILCGIFVPIYIATFSYPPEIVAFPRFLLWIFLGLSIILFFFPGKHPEEHDFKDIVSKEKITSLLLLIIYVVLIPVLGYFVTTFSFAVIYMWVFSKKDLKKYVIIAAVYLTIIYFVFQKWLNVWFPKGLIM